MKTTPCQFLLTAIAALLVLGALPVAQAAPVQAQNGPRLERGTLVFQGKARSYYLYAPASYQADRPTPLLLVLHGYLGNDLLMMNMTGFNELAEKEGFLVVYPNALHARWKSYSAPSERTDEDVAFIRTLIQKVEGERNIDARRIYATGFSSGGFFSQRLACELSDKIAAIAPVAATIGVPLKESCRPGRPVPVLMINGVKDPIITWKGKIRKVRYAFWDSVITSVPEAVDFWRKHNRCAEIPQSELIVHATQGIRGAEIKTFPGCSDSAEVKQIILERGGHTWPGSDHKVWPGGVLVGPTTHDINATEVIWEFFKEHPMPDSRPDNEPANES
ncbi:MAG TPA: PHB depolymerase family esterase [Coleofasciculaceae cyanobacterium]|jgi:polyhydroxybutyrate depolymerase